MFNGCPDKKEGFKLSQEIRSRSLLGNKPAWLGFTLQAGIDVDKNKHPDVLVTAPRAETAFVLRLEDYIRNNNLFEKTFRFFNVFCNVLIIINSKTIYQQVDYLVYNKLVYCRTRTVLKFETSLELSKNKIDLFSCYKKNSACVKAKFCILYTGKMVEKEIG